MGCFGAPPLNEQIPGSGAQSWGMQLRLEKGAVLFFFSFFFSLLNRGDKNVFGNSCVLPLKITLLQAGREIGHKMPIKTTAALLPDSLCASLCASQFIFSHARRERERLWSRHRRYLETRS